MNRRRLPKLALVILLGVLACCGSCTRIRTVYVPSGEPMQLRKTIRNAPVWVLDKNGVRVPGQVDLPEGWWVLDDPGEDDG